MRTHKCHCLFVPPHVLESIARSGRDEVRESARLSIQQSNIIRQHRAGVARTDVRAMGMLYGQQPVAPAAAQAKREVWNCQNQMSLRVPPRARAEGEPPVGDADVNCRKAFLYE